VFEKKNGGGNQVTALLVALWDATQGFRAPGMIGIGGSATGGQSLFKFAVLLFFHASVQPLLLCQH
jgi:hypothetical protein